MIALTQEITATVKFYNVEKGFGFLICEGLPDTYFNTSNVEEFGLTAEDVVIGAKVVVDVVPGKRERLQARRIQRIGAKDAFIRQLVDKNDGLVIVKVTPRFRHTRPDYEIRKDNVAGEKMASFSFLQKARKCIGKESRMMAA